METAIITGPEIIDIHVHLCRDTQQEKLVFAKAGWPDEWHWGSVDRIIPYMDARHISHVATMNVMDTGHMVERRIQRARAGCIREGHRAGAG